MGSEGYFLNQFIAARTNQRDDDWGGSYENRIRLPIEVVRRVREAVGEHFIIIFRLSMLDLVDGGSTAEEVIQLGKSSREGRRHYYQYGYRLARSTRFQPLQPKFPAQPLPG